MSEKVLKFPKQIYVGLRSEGEGVPPLGYATPIAIRKPKKITILERDKKVELKKELVEGVPLRLVAGDTSCAVLFSNKEDMLKYEPTVTGSQFYNELYKGYTYVTEGLIELK